jgi:hypothetical protein
MSSSKPETKKAVEEAREELRSADMGKFDRALRALLKVSSSKKPHAHKRKMSR